MIELNEKAITDEMLALSALRTLTAREEGGGAGTHLRRMLTRDHLPGLRVILRMVFAETLLELAGHVENCAMDADDCTDTPSEPYNQESNLLPGLTLRGESRWSNGMRLTVKRHLEHIVAAGTLGWAATEGDAEFAALLQGRREAALSALKEHLAGAPELTVGAGWP